MFKEIKHFLFFSFLIFFKNLIAVELAYTVLGVSGAQYSDSGILITTRASSPPPVSPPPTFLEYFRYKKNPQNPSPSSFLFPPLEVTTVNLEFIAPVPSLLFYDLKWVS